MNIRNVVEDGKCTGCGLCETICPMNAISIQSNIQGFFSPIISSEKCVECGKCYVKCPTISKYDARIFSGYSFSIENLKKLKCSSSGGVASALADYYFSINGVVYGVEYSNDFKDIVFNRYTRAEDSGKYKGSKYSEPFPPDYNSIIDDIKSGKPCLFIGLPCQVAAVRNLLNNNHYNNVLLVGLFCLGKSSIKLYRNFICDMERNSKSRIVYINMRYKKKDWNTSWMLIKFANGKEYKRVLSCDEFGLISHEFFRPSCYSCHFKLDNTPADILIGDFWGAEFLNKKAFNKMGTSAVICFNQKSNEIIKHLKGRLFKVDVQSILRTNKAITISAKKPDSYDRIMAMIGENEDLDKICKTQYGIKRIYALRFKYFIKANMPNGLVNKIKSFLNKAT